MGLIKWRYIWRYVTAENIKNIIKTVGYIACSAEHVATIYINDAARFSLLLVIVRRVLCRESKNSRYRVVVAKQLQTTLQLSHLDLTVAGRHIRVGMLQQVLARFD